MSDPRKSKNGDPNGRNSRDHTPKTSPGVPSALELFKPSRVLQRSTEALAALQRDKSVSPPLNSFEAEELVTAHRIEKPPTGSRVNVQAILHERDSQEARYDYAPMDVQSSRSEDTQSKKRPRMGDSPEATHTQEAREQGSERGLAGARQLVDYFSGWMSAQKADVEMANDFWGMVSYLRDCCEDVAKQMAFLEERLAERAEMKDLIKNEIHLMLQERPLATNTGYADAAARAPRSRSITAQERPSPPVMSPM